MLESLEEIPPCGEGAILCWSDSGQSPPNWSGSLLLLNSKPPQKQNRHKCHSFTASFYALYYFLKGSLHVIGSFVVHLCSGVNMQRWYEIKQMFLTNSGFGSLCLLFCVEYSVFVLLSKVCFSYMSIKHFVTTNLFNIFYWLLFFIFLLCLNMLWCEVMGKILPYKTIVWLCLCMHCVH